MRRAVGGEIGRERVQHQHFDLVLARPRRRSDVKTVGDQMRAPTDVPLIHTSAVPRTWPKSSTIDPAGFSSSVKRDR